LAASLIIFFTPLPPQLNQVSIIVNFTSLNKKNSSSLFLISERKNVGLLLPFNQYLSFQIKKTYPVLFLSFGRLLNNLEIALSTKRTDSIIF